MNKIMVIRFTVINISVTIVLVTIITESLQLFNFFNQIFENDHKDSIFCDRIVDTKIVSNCDKNVTGLIKFSTLKL